MKTAIFSKKVIEFYLSLQPAFHLPADFTLMNPYADAQTLALTTIFYNKYFNDVNNRFFIFGINPGRFGGGLTGIPFTDPFHLKQDCHIEHQLPLKKELSSQFIYKMILAYGGLENFYGKFFLTAVCPLGFVSQHKNANYYDSPGLIKASHPFIMSTLKKQSAFGCFTATCFCLGQGKNYEHLQALNREIKLFKNIVPLAHPRWIMQYRRKSADDYIHQYIDAFSKV